ncbi:LysR substrate-binding domain-containing protein [Nonomuraea bangladeshensis]|uniref:LysR family transcriptional regulator n=1 Tax=Nonomuraea bangladeshensis TaxID=404385 RepID=UPI003C2AFFAA
MLTLDQIRAFVAVAEELHFGRAAERLRMTQPPLSRHIQKLERAIGVTLLERDNRRVILTEAGRGFLEDARHMLTLVDTAGDRARRIAGGASGTLRLGFTAVSAISVLGPLLRLLAERLPEVDVILHEQVTARQMDGILRGELDLGLARPPFDLPRPSSSVRPSRPSMDPSHPASGPGSARPSMDPSHPSSGVGPFHPPVEPSRPSSGVGPFRPPVDPSHPAFGLDSALPSMDPSHPASGVGSARPPVDPSHPTPDLGSTRPPVDPSHPTPGLGSACPPLDLPHPTSRLDLAQPPSDPARPSPAPTVADSSSPLDLARPPINPVRPLSDLASARPPADVNRARSTYDLAGIDSRVIFREPLCAAVPTGHALAALDRPLAPEDFAGLPMVSYHPVQSRYFHELTVRFLSTVRPRDEQQVHQILTAVLLVAAGRGVALVPASARSLGIEGVVFRDLVHGGGSPTSASRSGNPITGDEGDELTVENDSGGHPVELHAIWNRGSANPALWRVLELLEDVEGQD